MNIRVDKVNLKNTEKIHSRKSEILYFNATCIYHKLYNYVSLENI